MIISKKKFEMEINRRMEKAMMDRDARESVYRLEEDLRRTMNIRDERLNRRLEELQMRIDAIDHKDDQRHCPYNDPVNETANCCR